MAWIGRLLQPIRLALQFLTILPVLVSGSVEAEDIQSSAKYYPLAGAVIGLLLYALYRLGLLLFPHLVAAVLVVIASTWITGGLHVDGLMDTADGLGSRKPREKMLEIMRDSRVGAIGAMAGSLTLLLKFALICSLAPAAAGPLFAEIYSASRFCMVLAMAWFPYARGTGGGLGSLFAKQLATREIVASAALLIVIDWICAWTGFAGHPAQFACALIVPILFSLAFTWLAGTYLQKKLGGMTGDTYGAINELAETAGLLVVLCVEHLRGVAA